jgi:ribonucleoside-triphosphate reductase
MGRSIDVKQTVEEYLDRSDWRVRANANQGFSLGGLILNVSGKVTANYWLDEVYSAEVGAAHRNGDLHIHDLDVLGGYCAGWSLRQLLHEGFGGVPGKIESGPAKHFSSALGQIVNFFGTLQNEWAGAQAFSSFDTLLAPYVRLDNLNYDQVHQGIQELVYNLNVPSRWGTQTPFTNLTFDLICPDDFKDEYPMVGEDICDFTYGELAPEMALINRAFVAVMTAGDATGRAFTFPIPTYNITKDFDWESPVADAIFEMTAKYGTPYFQNFVSSELNPGDVRSMCCRLQLDLRELLKRGNGLFGSGEQTGSIGVVTLNLARLGYLYGPNGAEHLGAVSHAYGYGGLVTPEIMHPEAEERGPWAALLSALDHLIEISVDSLEAKRLMVQQLIDDGLFPYTRRYLGSLSSHFSTIGINGVNEMIRNFTEDREDITTPGGRLMALELLDHIREQMVIAQERTGNLYNLEATPAEGTTYRFAREDKARFTNIIQAGTAAEPYYTNSSQLPVNFTDDPFEALEAQEELQTKYTGGTVLHLYLGERLANAEACKSLVRRSLENFRLPYLTITPTFSVCEVHGYLVGEQHTCPTCQRACEVWTRVMGYLRPVSSFNTGKQGEFHERTPFAAPELVPTPTVTASMTEYATAR